MSKVLLLCEFFDESVNYQENTLHKYYVKNGHQLTVVTSTFDGIANFMAGKHDNTMSGRTYTYGGAKIVRLPFRFNLLNKIRPFRGFREVLEAEAPDVVVMFDPMYDLLDVVEYKKRHPALRFVMNSSVDASNSAFTWLSRVVLHGVIKRWLTQQALPHLDAVYPITPHTADFLTDRYGVPPSLMELLPLGVDVEIGREVQAKQEGAALRETLGIPSDEVVIVTGGRMRPVKKVELLIEAFKRLPLLPMHLVIFGAAEIGHDDYFEGLKKAAEGDSRIRFTGWADKLGVYRHLDMGDVAIFPASQSVVWVQAIAMDLPLVVGDSGGQDYSFLNCHDNIIVYPAGQISVDSYCRALERLVGDPELRKRMSQGARRTTEERLDWNRLVWTTLGQQVPEAI